MDIFNTRDVFTPTKPARIAFVERQTVNDKLVNALQTPGKQIVVYGHSGTGKTTLLINKLNQLYEQHVTTRCMKGLKFEQLILDAFDQLDSYYTNEINHKKNEILSGEISAQYLAIKAKIGGSQSSEIEKKNTRILPPQLTPQALGKFLGNRKACWILEDFHKIDNSEKEHLSQLMKVFMDLSDEYADLKIIALGAVDTARQVVDYDPEMKNRVSEIHVNLMTEEEIEEIISRGERALNIRFNTAIKKSIAKHSNGLASVCHHLCLNMCICAGINETNEGEALLLNQENLENAVKMYVDEASDTIKQVFQKALCKKRKTKFNDAEVIIQALCSLKEAGAAWRDIHYKIKISHPSYPEANLKKTLKKLCSSECGEIIRYNEYTNLYSFSDPFYRAYALADTKSASTVLVKENISGVFEKTLLLLIERELLKYNK